ERNGVEVALNNRDQRIELQLARGAVGPLAYDLRFVRDRGRYLGHPALHRGVLHRHLLAEERDRTQILGALLYDQFRHQTQRAVAQHVEPGVTQRKRAEKAERGGTQRVELFGRELVAVDVRHIRVEAAAEEIAAIRREHEPLRHR